MQVTKMMKLYAAVILVWTTQVSANLNYANSGLTAVPAAVNNGNLDSNSIGVDLSGNQLATFNNDLTCCTQISTLDLSRNVLTSVIINRASGLVINTLTLSNNNLQNSPQISTQVANNLKELFLDDNSLTSLDPTLLAALTTIDKISLLRNSFTVLPDFSASRHTLTNLDLEGNSITNITTMHNIGSLQRIDAKYNSLQTFPETMGTVSQVTSFNLYENQIQIVPNDDFAAFGALHYMDISRNRLTQLPNISMVGNTLQYLYAWGNSINSIDPSNFNNVKVLKYLSLAGNGMTAFPDMGTDVGKTLETLDLNSNGLTDSSADKFYNLGSLTLLNLQVNHFTQVPNISTSNLVNLQLANNQIQANGLSTLSGKNISHLDLSSNSITSLNGLTGLETTLVELNVKSNPIASIDYAVLAGYTKLNTIDLSSTTLTTIPDLTNIQPLITLKLESIPLVCDCYARWLTQWTSSASGRVLVISANPCQQPANLVNVAWASLQLDECPVVTTETITTTQEETTTEYITSTEAATVETTAIDISISGQITTAQSMDIVTTGEVTTALDTNVSTTELTTISSLTTVTAVSTSITGCLGNIESTLMTKLLTNYDKTTRPVLNQSEAVPVQLGLVLQQIITLNERDQELKTKVWMRYTWTDAYLTWNASEYCDISSVRIYPDQIWRPDITLYDDLNGEPNDNDAKLFPADVQSDGSVSWNTPKIISSTCDVDMRYYPFDEQKCTLKFSSWTFDGSKLDLSNNSTSGDLSYFTGSGEWNVIELSVKKNSVVYSCCAKPVPDVTFTIHLRRKPMYYLFNLILPAVLMSAITILVFVLPPESGEKMSLGVGVLLALTVFLLLVSDSVPKTDTVPVISQYFEATIALMALSCFLSVITLNVHNRGMFSEEVPNWIRKLVLDWMARPLCLKAKVDKNISPIMSDKIVDDMLGSYPTPRSGPFKANKVWPKGNVEEGVGCEAGVILVQEKTVDEIAVKHDRTETEQSLQEILGMLRGFQEGKQNEDHKEACKTDWKLVSMVIDRFLLFVFLVLTVGVTAIILSNHPYYTQPVIA